MKRVAWISFAALTSLVATPAIADDTYVVKAGDACDTIAAKVYGDARQIDFLHRLNPELGPLPHKLKAGLVLRTPPLGADAKLTFLRNKVETATPTAKPGVLLEDLSRGHKVSTLSSSSAEVTFRDTSRIQLGEHTLVVIFGATSSVASAKSTVEDTTLVNGSLRAHLGELVAGKRDPLKIKTAGGTKLELGVGESKVAVDDKKKSTSLSVYKGESKLASGGKTVAVPAGFGSKAMDGAIPSKPKKLPLPPAWIKPLPAVLLTFDPTADAEATYEGKVDPDGSPLGGFHVQLAKDARFNDLLVDTFSASTAVKNLQIKNLAPGRYFARVSSVDAEFFEGTFSSVSELVVAHARIEKAEGKRAELHGLSGLYCSVERSDKAATGTVHKIDYPLALDPLAPYKIQCADGPLGVVAPSGALSVTADKTGTPQTDFVIEPSKDGKVRVVALVRDASGKGRVGLRVGVKAEGKLDVSPVTELPTPGHYVATVPFTAGSRETLVWSSDGTELGKTSLDFPAKEVVHVEGPKAPPSRLDLALGVEGATGSSNVGLGGGVFVAGALRSPQHGYELSAGLHFGFSSYGKTSGSTNCEPDVLFCDGVNEGFRTYEASRRIRAYIAGITFRASIPLGTHETNPTPDLKPKESERLRFFGSLMLRPEMIGFDSRVTATFPNLERQAAQISFLFAGSAALGVTARFAGQYLGLDVGYRFASEQSLDGGPTSIGGLTLALGYGVSL